MRATWVTWASRLLLGLVFVLAPRGVRAQIGPLVLLLEADDQGGDSELSARIRGQTRDLALSLTVARSAVSRLGSEQARAEAARAGAQVVVWTRADGPTDMLVQVLDVDSGALRTRSVRVSERETLASSATAEMAALVVRGELAALLGERDERAAQPEEPAPSPPRAATTAAEPPLERAPDGDASWLATLAYRPSVPANKTVAHGFLLQLRRRVGSLLLGVAAHAALPFTLSNDDARIRLRRGGVRLEAVYELGLTPSLRLSAGVAAGVVVSARATQAASADLAPTDESRNVAGTVGPLGELSWQLSRRVGLSLGVGLDAVPFRTKFAYDTEAGQRTLASLARVEPWMAVGFFGRWGGNSRTP